jgi:plasmid stability protein
MAQILVRNIDEDVKDALKERAEAHGRSLEEEVRLILLRASLEPKAPQRGLGTELVDLFADLGITEDIPEIRGGGFQPVDFDE